jgi:hypothetical protein
MEQKSINSFFAGDLRGIVIHSEDNYFSSDYHKFNEEIQDAIYLSEDKRITSFTGVTYHEGYRGRILTSQEGFGPETPIGETSTFDRIIISDNTGDVFEKLSKFINRQVRIFLVNRENYIFGTKDKAGNFKGFLSSIQINKGNGETFLNIEYSDSYQNEEECRSYGIRLENKIENLTEVVLQRVDKNCAKVVLAINKEDLTEIFKDDLANTDLYFNKTKTNPISVIYDKERKVLIFSPADKYRIAEASILMANKIEDFDGKDEYTDLK